LRYLLRQRVAKAFLGTPPSLAAFAGKMPALPGVTGELPRGR
jgi:hypothetical protein